MKKERKEMLEKLRNVKNMEEYNLEMLGKSDEIEIDDVKYLGEVELEYREDGKKKYQTINVYAVIEGKTVKYYSDDMPLGAETKGVGKNREVIVPSLEYERMFEKDNPIKDIIEDLKQMEIEEQEKSQEERTVVSLNELENNEQKKETKNNKEEQEQEDNILTREKPKYVIQSINVDSTYIDNYTTVRHGFKLPPQVKEIAIAKPMQNDENNLIYDMTIYMLDDKGRIIEDVDGKTIKDFFKVDRETGKNPQNDENTKINLNGSSERDKTHTMRRFKSRENPDLYLSAEQKKIGDYAKLYAGRKTADGTDSVEVQLETRNVGIQTSLKMQQIVDGHKGIYNIDSIDKAVDEFEEQGGEIKNIPLEIVDREENDEYEGRFRKGPWDK